MPRLSQLSLAATCSSVLLLTACTGGSTVDDDVEGADAGAGSLTSINAGYVSAIDQIGLPIGTERGLFEERDLDVTLAEPFPTGVDAINALEAGDVDIIQVGTPAIAAAQEGAELSLIGNYTGSATQRSIDETAAIVAAEGSEIDSEEIGRAHV